MEPLKVIPHPTDPARTYKMGRKVPRARRYGLKLSNYVDMAHVELPEKTNYASKAMRCLDQMLLNDELGDCTAAAAFHVEGVLRANAGIPVHFSNEQVVAFYSATTGYVPGRPETDQGGDENTVLNYWRDHGLYGSGRKITDMPETSTQGARGNPRHRILGHANVDATRADLVKAAIYLFENTYDGYSLPDAWVSPAPAASGWTWDVAGEPDESNGHAVAGVDYDEHGKVIASWGMLGHLTWAAQAKYGVFSAGGEMHTVFSEDSINTASHKAPNGFHADELYADFKKFLVA